ncbi:MAG: hypothetical protein JWM02_1192 [Frankiales bacterium]|nr:hypothetical protein [Frankiales bacterium]
MRLRTPFLGFLGLLAVGVVALQMFEGRLSVSDAAIRIGIVAAALTAVEKVAMPLARSLIATGTRRDP